MLSLFMQAPFAACRTLTAGWYRPTATFLTPSAAYGLLLNVAGIETRLREEDPEHDGRTPASLHRSGLPAVRLALGIPASPGCEADFPRVQTLYQQLHNYPVGKDAGMPEELVKGNKNNISPVRREFLVGMTAIICIEGNPNLEDCVRKGLRGELNSTRYGVLFVGDNHFLPDRLEERDPGPAIWFDRLAANSDMGARPRTTRLTIWIDRADMSRTVSALYAPTEEPTIAPPPSAWTDISPP